MPLQETRLQASGYRFLLRRVECALLDGQLRSAAGTRRAHLASLAFGCALAIAAVAGCAILGLLRPGLGDARMVVGRTSGALYVRVGDTWHPVLNLTSARLIARTDADPSPVRESELAHTKRGALLGIPGAPQFLPPPLPAGESVWTVCDDGAATTVLVGPVAQPRLAPDRAVLVAPPSGSPAYLLYRGRRAAVDLADTAVLHALRLQGQTPHPVSQTLLNAVPEAPPISVPRVPGAGRPAGAWLPGFSVGTVLRITRAAGDEYYVVLAAGVQRIGQVAADLLRFRDSQGDANVVRVAPDVIGAAPVAASLLVPGLPDQAPSALVADPTVCVTWTPVRPTADTGFVTGPGLPVPAGRQPVALAQADGRGPAVDAVYLPPGSSAYVAAQGLSGDGARAATRYLVTDTGVRFAVHDDDAAHDLGLPATASAAPWPVLAALPNGPELSRANASVSRDTVAAGP